MIFDVGKSTMSCVLEKGLFQMSIVFVPSHGSQNWVQDSGTWLRIYRTENTSGVGHRQWSRTPDSVLQLSLRLHTSQWFNQ